MRFGTLFLDGFGIHREQKFELDAQAPLVLFSGRNEAGKSTIMGFVRTMLFGFPTRARMPERYEPAGGGVHGGYLTLIDEQGNPIRLERYDKSGYPKLFLPDGTQAGEAELKRLLGGLTPDLYRNLFAFSLSELHRLETLQGDEISGFLYGSGTGVSGSAVVQAEKSLQGRMDQLFRPQGRRQAINIVLRELDDLDARIRKSKEESSHYNELMRELDELGDRIAAKDEELKALRRQAEWLNKCVQARDPWLAIRAMERELAEAPERYVLAPEAEALLAERAELDHRVQEASRLSRNRIERAELNRQLDNERAAMTRHLRQIDPSWTIEEARKFPFAVIQQDELDDYAQRFDRLQAGIAAAEEGLAALEAEGEQLALQAEADDKAVAERERELQERLPAEALADPEGYADSLQRAWQRVKEDATAWQAASHKRADARRSLDALPAGRQSTPAGGMRLFFLVAAVVIAGLAAGLLHVLTGEPFLAYGIGGLLLIGGITGALFVRPRQGQGGPLADMRRTWSVLLAEAEGEEAGAAGRFRESRDSLMRRLGELHGFAEAAAGRAGSDPQEAIRTLTPFMEQWEREMAGWRRLAGELEQARSVRGQTQKALDGWKIRRQRQADHLARLQEALATCRREWADWLAAFNLPADLRPQSLKLMRQYAEQALDKADQIAQLTARLDGLRGEEEACRQGAVALLDKHRICLEGQTGQALRYDEGDGDWQEALLRLAGLADEFAAIRQRREEMEEKRRHQLRLLDAWIPEAQRSDMEQLLLDHDADQLEGLLREAREKVEAAEEQLRLLNEQRGGQRSELERLLQGEGHADLLLSGEGKMAELEELAGQYAVSAMAALLIRKAREIHERERQPGVLRRASHYFSRMTQGRYVKVFSPMGEKDIQAEMADGQRLPSAMLSRGTAEQLYLAMRFALAEEYEKIVSLPLVMDDIFVNFDGQRLQETLGVLAEVAARRQVLLFTCHEHVAEAVMAALPDSQQIALPYSS